MQLQEQVSLINFVVILDKTEEMKRGVLKHHF